MVPAVVRANRSELPSSVRYPRDCRPAFQRWGRVLRRPRRCNSSLCFVRCLSVDFDGSISPSRIACSHMGDVSGAVSGNWPPEMRSMFSASKRMLGASGLQSIRRREDRYGIIRRGSLSRFDRATLPTLEETDALGRVRTSKRTRKRSARLAASVVVFGGHWGPHVGSTWLGIARQGAGLCG